MVNLPRMLDGKMRKRVWGMLAVQIVWAIKPARRGDPNAKSSWLAGDTVLQAS